MSGDYIMINIRSQFKPSTNEIWLKHAGKESELEKFWLVQPMSAGVRYTIKHSGEFLYKMSNEEDKINFKVRFLIYLLLFRSLKLEYQRRLNYLMISRPLNS